MCHYAGYYYHLKEKKSCKYAHSDEELKKIISVQKQFDERQKAEYERLKALEQ
jgi:hypothetical protein